MDASPGACEALSPSPPDGLSVAVLLLVDRSVHWGDADASGLWPAVVNALSTFAAEPYTTEAQIALGYFPGDPGDAGACGGDFTLAVPFQPGRRDAATAIRTSLEQVKWGGPRALGPSLASALDYVEKAAPPGSGHHLVVVTGGAGECVPRDLGSITSAHPGVTATLLGVGPGLSTLSELTVPFATASFLETGDEASLLGALTEGSGLSSSCTIRIPHPPQGLSFDTTRVNVELRQPDGALQVLAYVANANACATTPDAAWYYDSETAPTAIHLCDATCAQALDTSVGVVFGCPHHGPDMR
jgi:hypothetical protein